MITRSNSSSKIRTIDRERLLIRGKKKIFFIPFFFFFFLSPPPLYFEWSVVSFDKQKNRDLDAYVPSLRDYPFFSYPLPLFFIIPPSFSRNTHIEIVPNDHHPLFLSNSWRLFNRDVYFRRGVFRFLTFSLKGKLLKRIGERNVIVKIICKKKKKLWQFGSSYLSQDVQDHSSNIFHKSLFTVQT